MVQRGKCEMQAETFTHPWQDEGADGARRGPADDLSVREDVRPEGLPSYRALPTRDLVGDEAGLGPDRE